MQLGRVLGVDADVRDGDEERAAVFVRPGRKEEVHERENEQASSQKSREREKNGGVHLRRHPASPERRSTTSTSDAERESLSLLGEVSGVLEEPDGESGVLECGRGLINKLAATTVLRVHA
jgi:hypothetical protein